MGKKKQKNLNYTVFFEDDCFNPRLQLEQKIGISLSPPKITPQKINNQQDQQQVTMAVIQPTISAMYNQNIEFISKISKEENLSKEIQQSEVKLKPTETFEQKIMFRPVQLKPVIIQFERERSSRKK
ncbi:unnamed protein product (macronuclear) [Paramecium tetraurelia]|uniref:Uncharacterized protein n=1 Tax=Paramecium tetraurelia TaxID=5888 RepID=A0CRT6_PARTE|nr:uncharacterized protein GSPATT00009818001 [Paramecium tetraurelia]CAK73503.1 unnamed protein product [Paramecium tetraurelia]|eukprot:XP_001440900.1 hypothetical protein (macronuclear) [Paramecium tetraurelia strain d4-2]